MFPEAYSTISKTPIYDGSIDLYQNGTEDLGNAIVARSRNKQLELHRPEFIGQIQPDPWNSLGRTSMSLRTGKADKIMQMQPVTDNYSENKKLNFYKTALIQTKAMDHQIPFIHSMSVRSQQAQNRRPINSKVYKNSLMEQINPETHKKFFVNSTQRMKFANDKQLAINNPTKNSEKTQSELYFLPEKKENTQISSFKKASPSNIQKFKEIQQNDSKLKDQFIKTSIEQYFNRNNYPNNLQSPLVHQSQHH